MSELIIYGVPMSTYVWTARAACAVKGVPHTLTIVPMAELKAPAHLARHPFGKWPAMKHGDVQLFETRAIVSYVDKAFDGPALQPSDAAALGLMEQWVSTATSYIYPRAVMPYILEYVIPRGEGGTPRRAHIDAALPAMQALVDILDARLGDGPFVVGDTLTVADLYLAPLLMSMNGFPESKAMIAGAPKLSRLLGALSRVPEILSVAPRS